jgi:hypothetical protein
MSGLHGAVGCRQRSSYVIGVGAGFFVRDQSELIQLLLPSPPRRTITEVRVRTAYQPTSTGLELAAHQEA